MSVVRATRYRKRPMEIDALQYTGGNVEALQMWCPQFHLDEAGIPYIDTLEGRMHVSVGDFIICGVEGEFYPCKETVFQASYEVVR